MNNEIIKLLEKKRNEIRSRVLRKGIFASKSEKELLDKYDELLLEQYSKLIN